LELVFFTKKLAGCSEIGEFNAVFSQTQQFIFE